MTTPIDWPRGPAGTWLSGNLDQYRRDPRARNGRVARQSLVKRLALGTARQKALGKKGFVHISLCSFEFRFGT